MSATAEHFRTDHLLANMKSRAIRGAAVTVASQGAKFVLQTGSTMILARLLSPAEFGVVAMVTTVTGFIAMFKDAGLSMATIQRDCIVHEQISTLFWVNVALSAVLMLVAAAFAPLLSWFYGEPRLTLITLALAGTFVLSGLTVQHQALLQRQMRFKALATIQVLSLAAGVIAAIAIAACTRTYWALVAMHLASTATNTAGVWYACRWMPGAPRRRADVWPMLRFGGNLTISGVVNYFARNADNMLIGWWWGAGPLGIYSKAYGLLLLPLRQVNGPVLAVTIPALGRLRDDPKRFRNAYLRILRVTCLITMPMMALMIAGSESLVRLVLGEAWAEASLIFAWLGIAGLVQPVNTQLGALLVSQDRSRDYLWTGVVTGIITVGVFIITVPHGIQAMAIGYALMNLAVTPGLWIWVGRTGCVSASQIASAVAYPLGIACAGLLTAVLVHILVTKSQWLEDLHAVTATFVAMSGAVVVRKKGRMMIRELSSYFPLLFHGYKRPSVK